MNIYFYDSIKEYTQTSDFNYLYLNEFNKGNIGYCTTLSDFNSIFGDYTSQSYEAVKQLLKQQVPINVGRVMNFAKSDMKNDIYCRTAYKLVSFNNDEFNTNYNQKIISSKLLSTDGIQYQLPVNNFMYLISKYDSQWNDVDLTDEYYNFFTTTDNTITFTTSDTISNKTLKLRIFSITRPTDQEDFTFLNNISVSGIYGLEDGDYNFSYNETTKTLVIKQDDDEIYNDDLETNEDMSPNIKKLPLPNEIGGFIYCNADFLFDVKVSSENITIDSDSYYVESVLNSNITESEISFYSNLNDYYFYDEQDKEFNNRFYNSNLNVLNQPQLCVFSKSSGLYGNSIKIEINGKNFTNYDIDSDTFVVNVLYNDTVVETHQTSDFNISSNYVNMIFLSNNEGYTKENINLMLSLSGGNDGVNDLQSYKDSFTRLYNKNYKIILSDYYPINNVEYFNHISSIVSDSGIILSPIPLANTIEYFYNKISHSNNTFLFDGFYNVAESLISKYFYILSQINLVLNGEYRRLINIPLSENLSDVNNQLNKNTIEGVNYFESGLLKREISTQTSTLGKQLIIKFLKDTMSEQLKDFIFGVNIDIDSMVRQLNKINDIISGVTVTCTLIDVIDNMIEIKCEVEFNNEVDVITFNVVQEI